MITDKQSLDNCKSAINNPPFIYSRNSLDHLSKLSNTSCLLHIKL